MDGWHRAGALSCAHWLSWRGGMDLGAAREKVRVAKKLAELPAIDEALRKGEISYSKVRAMTRVATAKTKRTSCRWHDARPEPSSRRSAGSSGW